MLLCLASDTLFIFILLCYAFSGLVMIQAHYCRLWLRQCYCFNKCCGRNSWVKLNHNSNSLQTAYICIYFIENSYVQWGRRPGAHITASVLHGMDSTQCWKHYWVSAPSLPDCLTQFPQIYQQHMHVTNLSFYHIIKDKRRLNCDHKVMQMVSNNAHWHFNHDCLVLSQGVPRKHPPHHYSATTTTGLNSWHKPCSVHGLMLLVPNCPNHLCSSRPSDRAMFFSLLRYLSLADNRESRHAPLLLRPLISSRFDVLRVLRCSSAHRSCKGWLSELPQPSPQLQRVWPFSSDPISVHCCSKGDFPYHTFLSKNSRDCCEWKSQEIHSFRNPLIPTILPQWQPLKLHFCPCCNVGCEH